MATGGNNVDAARRKAATRAYNALPMKLVIVSKGGGASVDAACGEWADAIALCDASIDILRAHGEDRAAGVAARVMTAAAAAAAAKSSRTKKSKAKASSSSSSPSHPSVAALGEDDDDPLFSLD